MTALLPLPAAAAIAALAGFTTGLLYFAALRHGTHLLAEGRNWKAASALTAGRLAGVGVFFFLAAQAGTWPLLAAFAGFLMGRAVSLRTAKRGA